MMERRWQEKAECAQPHSGCTGEDFFYEGRFPPNSKEQRTHIARLRIICDECLVFAECRTFVDRYRFDEGFWAGETATERQDRWYGRRRLNPISVVPERVRRAAKD